MALLPVVSLHDSSYKYFVVLEPPDLFVGGVFSDCQPGLLQSGSTGRGRSVGFIGLGTKTLAILC